VNAGEGPAGSHALTILQPRADAIARGTQDVENRTLPSPRHVIGQHIAVHAGLRFERDARAAAARTDAARLVRASPWTSG